MKKIVINKSYGRFCLSHQAFLRLREMGQQEALTEEDLCAYWPEAVRRTSRASIDAES